MCPRLQRAKPGSSTAAGNEEMKSLSLLGDLDTSQIFGGTDHRLHQREELDLVRAEYRAQDADF